MSQSHYAPPASRVDDPEATDASLSRAAIARIVAFRVAGAAATVVACGTLANGLLFDHSKEPFGYSPKAILWATVFFSVGTFIWSWCIAFVAALIGRAATTGSLGAAVTGGALFALLTPALGYLLGHTTFSEVAYVLILGLWTLTFPLAATLIAIRKRPPPNSSPERGSV